MDLELERAHASATSSCFRWQLNWKPETSCFGRKPRRHFGGFYQIVAQHQTFETWHIERENVRFHLNKLEFFGIYQVRIFPSFCSSCLDWRSASKFKWNWSSLSLLHRRGARSNAHRADKPEPSPCVVTRSPSIHDIRNENDDHIEMPDDVEN